MHVCFIIGADEFVLFIVLFLFLLAIQVASVKMSNFIIQILLLAYGIIIWSIVVDLIWLQMPYIVYY